MGPSPPGIAVGRDVDVEDDVVRRERQTAEKRMGEMFALIDRQLGDGPYLLGERYSAADPYLLMLVRWGRHFAPPPRSLPNLARHAERVIARPAVREAFAREGIAAPFV